MDELTLHMVINLNSKLVFLLIMVCNTLNEPGHQGYAFDVLKNIVCLPHFCSPARQSAGVGRPLAVIASLFCVSLFPGLKAGRWFFQPGSKKSAVGFH